MPSKHNAGGCKCCGCYVTACECTVPETGSKRCIPAFQVKVEGVTQHPASDPPPFGYVTCNECEEMFNGIWYQHDCVVDGTGDKTTMIKNAGGCQYYLTTTIVRTATKFSIYATFSAKGNPALAQDLVYAIWEWNLDASGDCVDFSDTAGTEATSLGLNGAYPCSGSDVTSVLLRWVA